MADIIKRPEDYELDDQQNSDLFAFFKSQSKSELKRQLNELDKLSAEDMKYGGGGLPANLNKAMVIIRDILGL
jgi:ribosomal 50S subunit-associated protein YjgA (DUF615 family)